MSLLRLACILIAVSANELPPEIAKLENAVQEMNKEAATQKESSSAPQLPADVAALEAAVQAKVTEETASSEASTPTTRAAIEAALEAAVQGKVKEETASAETSTPTLELPADVASLEAAVQAKVAEEGASADATTSPTPELPADVAALEAAVQAKVAEETASAEVSTPTTPQLPSDVAALEAAVQAKVKEEQSTTPTAELPADDAALEAAVQDKVKEETESSETSKASESEVPKGEARPGAGLNIRTREVSPSGAAPELPADVAALEAAVQKQVSEESSRAEIPNKSPSSELPADVAALEAAVQEKVKEETASAETPTTPTPELPADVATLEAAVEKKVTEETASVVGQKKEKEQQPLVGGNSIGRWLRRKFQRKPAAIEVTASAETSEAAKAAAIDAALQKAQRERLAALAERARADEKRLAEQRAEVEQVFHVSKPINSATGVPEVEEPMAAGRKLFRFIFYLAALLSLGGVAYHKMEVVRQICEEYQGPLKFKAKERDMLPRYSSEPARATHQKMEGTVASIVNKGVQKLSRRGGASATYSREIGV
jgi:hypothetical protein